MPPIRQIGDDEWRITMSRAEGEVRSILDKFQLTPYEALYLLGSLGAKIAAGRVANERDISGDPRVPLRTRVDRS